MAVQTKHEIRFGTAGIRGIMGDREGEINEKTINCAAAAFCSLIKMRKEYGTIAVAYDTRRNSRKFAENAALTAAAEGMRVHLFRFPAPVPLLSYAVRRLECDGGIMITASHNPKEYNGLKAYDSTGCQLGREDCEKVQKFCLETENARCMDKNEAERLGLLRYIDGDILEKYAEAVKRPAPKRRIKVVYTPLHGTGAAAVKKLISDSAELIPVREQYIQNGDFPTVKFPNPENPEAVEMALKLAEDTCADLVLTTDPDCDRIGAAVRHRGGYFHLTGNQLGVLLTEYLLSTGKYERPFIVKSVVTDELGAEIAKTYGAEVIETLTGFRFIGEILNKCPNPENFVLGYEESGGFLAQAHVRDKDGATAAMFITEMTAYYLAKNMTLADVLENLYKKYGCFAEHKDSYELADEKISRITEKLRDTGASLFKNCDFYDYKKGLFGLPEADVLKYVLPDGSWAAVRPSGTEPVVKVYYSARGGSMEEALKKLDKMRKTLDNAILK